MTKLLDLSELLIEVQPFSDGLKRWCKDHPDFTKALKIIYPERFVSLGAVVTTYPPHYPNDQVIGFYAYDYKLKVPKFKQDFIINLGKQDNNFALYTRQKLVPTNGYIKDINEFFATYGRDGNYLRAHHVTFDDIPDELKPRAAQAAALGNKVRETGIRYLDKQALIKANRDLQALRDNGSINPIWTKIRGAHN